MKNKEASEIFNKIQRERFVIYGAGIVAKGIAIAIQECFYRQPDYFVISDKDNYEETMLNIPVLSVEEFSRSADKSFFVFIATPEVYHDTILNTLKELGYTNVAVTDSDTEYAFMSKYFREKTSFVLLKDICRDAKKDAHTDLKVYMAKFFKDIKLTKSYDIPSWIEPIQVGTAISEMYMPIIHDNDGIHISEQNKKYSELTATYWVWKNTKHAYKGICHYRRMLDMTKEEVACLCNAGVDVILPLPFVCEKGAYEQYGRYISENDFVVLVEVMSELYPNKTEEIRQSITGRYIYNYNMLIAKETVFEEYCDFLFSILFEVDRRYVEKGQKREDRYLGYLGELITSTFFLMNQKKWKIAHAKKIWMI